jgi:aspartate carbamoyltransferase catalytic subunit
VSRAGLLSIGDLGREGIVEVLRLADSFAEVSARAIPKVPALRGKTVATVFFEASTRTRLSFEAAAKRLSADTMSFAVTTSSVTKGESLRDTVETVDALGVDVMVVRHASSGAAAQVARWVDACVVNAGDGQHEHPTQALLDCFTLREALAARAGSTPVDDLDGVRIAIVGDVGHSRVARSCVLAFGALGARVTLVGPATLMPPTTQGWGVEVRHDLDEVLPEIDVCYLLRLQSERLREALLPSLGEYSERFGLTRDRARRLDPDLLVMHPGPMIRGLEIASEVADSARSLVTRQVRNGVAVRMAVLFRLLAGGLPPVPGGMDPGALATAQPEPETGGAQHG